MGSKSSKTKRPTPIETKTTVVPMVSEIPQGSRIPYEIIDEILDHLVAGSVSRDEYTRSLTQKSLRSCSLASKSWVPLCRRHLFHTIVFTVIDIAKWLKMFPVPEESPTNYVRDFYFWLGGDHYAPEEFFKHTPWFTNAKKSGTFVCEVTAVCYFVDH